MPSVTVAPGVETTHDISLNNGAEIFGLILDGGERAMQEVPMSSPARQFTVNQTSYTSGRGRARLAKDQAGYFDSRAAYTLTEEIVHNAPRVLTATGLLAASVINTAASLAFHNHSDEQAVAFTPASTLYSTSVYMWMEYKGWEKNGIATFTIRADNAGNPGTVLQTATKRVGDIVGRENVKITFPAQQTYTAGTKYWIVVAPPSDWTQLWFGRGPANAAYPTKFKTAGVWNDAPFSQGRLFEVRSEPSGTQSDREFFDFNLYGAKFFVTKPKGASGSQIFVNGTIGKATGATATTIVDTGQAYTVDALIGAYVRITSGTGIGQVRQILDNDATGLTVATWDINPDTTSYFCVYGTPILKEVTGHGLTKVVSRPVVFGDVVYFPQGAGVNIRRGNFTGSWAWADDGTNRADFLTSYKDSIWRVLNEYSSTDKYAMAQYATVPAWGTNLEFLGTMRCGRSEYPVTNVIEWDGALYVAKQDSIWRIFDNVTSRLNLGIEIIPNDTNGKALAVLGGGLYFSWSHSVERLQGSVLDDIGWWKNEGMPTGRRGFCSSMSGALAWMYAALDGGTGRSAIMVHNGRGWHELYQGAPGDRIREVFWQQCPETNPYIWFSSRGDLKYMKFPNQTLNLLEDSAMVYEPNAIITTSTIDANDPTFYKIVKGVQVVSKNLGSNAYIDIDYQVNNDVGRTDEPGWTYAGRANISPVDFVPIGGDGKGEITQMRLRFRLVTEDSATPAIMYSWQITGHTIEPVKYQWNLRIKVSGNQNTKKSTPDHKPDDLLRFLDKAAREMQALRMRTKYETSDDKIVYVSPPTIVRTAINTILKQWTGSIIITLREA